MRRRILAVAAAALVLAFPATARATGQSELLAAVNSVRAGHGLRPVSISRRLHRVALRHSDDMMSRHYFAHTSPSGCGVACRFRDSGFPAGATRWGGGETLAYGYRTAQEVVSAWLRSPEHRAILLSPTWQRIGIGRARGVSRVYWTADWGWRH